MHKLLRMMLLMLWGVLMAHAQAQASSESPPDPEQVVRGITDRLLTLITEARDYYDENPQRYYSGIEALLDDVVDFRSFSRAVMGPWGSERLYRSLETPEARRQFEARVDRFHRQFKQSLIRTYGKGVLAFSGEKIDVLPVSDKDVADGSVYVTQLIHGDASEPYRVRYKLRLDEHNRWRMRNVQIQEINVGLLYRNQFMNAVRRYGGDVDRAIDTWRIDSDSLVEQGDKG